jgi:hypothetical protein
MSNHPWVCFACRRAVRRASPATVSVVCAVCGGDCAHLSPKTKIPPKDRIKAWEQLRNDVDLSRIARAENSRIAFAERKRWLRRRVKELEGEPPDAHRDYLLLKYREELDGSD